MDADHTSGDCAVPEGLGGREGGLDVVVALGWGLLLVACASCVVVCFVLASVASYRVHQLETAARAFDTRILELEERYRGTQNGAQSGAQQAARQAAAWGAEVLGDVAAGVPPEVAVQRSAARMRLPAVKECPLWPAASQAGSDVSRVSELRGFDDHGDGWVATTERALHNDQLSDAGVPTMTLMEFAGYRPPDTGACPRHRERPRSSPPRRISPY